MKPASPPPAKPEFRLLPALMFAGGLGMAMYYGHAWWQLPQYSAADLDASVELNLAADLMRHDEAFRNDAAQVLALRSAVRQELEQTIADEKREVQNYTGTGLILMALGLAQMLVLRRFAAR